MTKFFEVKNQTDKSFDLYFYGDICKDSLYKWIDEDKCPGEVTELLEQANGRDLNIFINSDGGSVSAGLAIYNQIKRYEGKKTITIDGIGASIASVIAFAGDKLIMPENNYFMLHQPHGVVMGLAEDCRRYAELLDGMEETILNIYEENAKEGVTREQIKEMLAKETWLNGRQAADVFNVDLVTENKAVAYLTDENKLPVEARAVCDKIRAETEKLELAKARLRLISIKNKVTQEI